PCRERDRGGRSTPLWRETWQRRPEPAFATLHLPSYKTEKEEMWHQFDLLQGDPRFIEASKPDNAKLAANCEAIKQTVLASGQDANRARYFAHNMLKRSTADAQLRKAAHDLLRYLEQLPNDGLQVCRSANLERHSTYREAALFTVNDYVFCIDSLLAQSKKEEAKAICKKALVVFPHDPQLVQRAQRLGVKKKFS
ncbi:MAG: hypothetical protein K5Q00_03205, partial [Gammaproteobacteria bacterium]|nr:hypothetical protein [Gammaproteobacteria bacterium]